MKVLIIKHVDNEGPGLMEDCLKEEDIPRQVLDLSLNSPLPDINSFSHIVLMGGPMNVYEEDRYPFLKKEDLFIKEAIQRGKRILGICLGAQLIAKALGAKVFKSPLKEIGWYDISLTKEGEKDFLFSSMPNTFPVFQWHEDSFELPNAGKLMATSSSVPQQAFRYGENAYGLQFHLEVTREMIRDWMGTYAEVKGMSKTLLPTKDEILAETERKIENYTKRDITFLKKFFT